MERQEMNSVSNAQMLKKGRVSLVPLDLVGLIYFVVVAVAFLHFREVMGTHPYMSGFLEFALLASFGECLRRRLVVGRWSTPKLALRTVVWGLFGIWITSDFVLVDSGVRQLAAAGLWPQIWHAFSTSLWLNLLSGYGFFMMMTHFVCDRIIDDGWQSPWDAISRPDFKPWARTVLLSLTFFWVPAHTITFLLPPTSRILFAACLSVMLGVLLTLGSGNARTGANDIAR